ncbi:T9SS type A sorting domain-containing protein [Brumimicrobium salinarum]|nr:T9SS type A sorting domain-containing protein [Brumimicrobium salinarum]
MKDLKHIYIFIFLNLLSFSIFSQSISGNMNSEHSMALGYGNVNIYKGKKMVASVLTDAEGNFNVQLDTGSYKVVFQYEGHEELVKNIHVMGNEKGNFALNHKEDYIAPFELESKKDIPPPDIYEESHSFSVVESKIDHSHKSTRRATEKSASSLVDISKGHTKPGRLTAGEINDFTKWEMWKDIAANELSKYQQKWDMFFTDRYTVQIKNENGYPMVDVLVQLVNESNKVFYESRTDNTGKAELWGGLSLPNQKFIKPSAVVHYQEDIFTIKRLKNFKDGINTFTLDANCKPISDVDIAFVVDATGSMGDEINYLKAELNDVIYKAKNEHPKLTFNFGNVFYRDHGDDYLTRRHDFTTVLSSSIGFITAQHASGGGDYEEAVDVALNEALDSLKWSQEARARILFLILDAPPHNTPEIRQKLKAIAQKAAAKGVRIVPLAASGIKKDTEYLMRCFALGTNGSYAFLTNHSGIGNTHIEPSTDEYEVELLNDLLVRIIETYSFMPECDRAITIGEVQDPEMNDSLIELDWNVWPNPTQGDLSIKVSEDIDEIFIADITGKILKRFTDIKKNRALKTNIAQYARGIYLVTFTHREKKYVKKIVLQ